MFSKEKSPAFVRSRLQKAKERLSLAQKISRPLVLAEKLLYSHLNSPDRLKESDEFCLLQPDRVILQDVTAQMALLQFMLAGKSKVAVPTSIHCDHLITAKKGVKEDMKDALISNKEVFDFLSSCAQKYGIGFWKPGAGIIHQVVLENYAFAGGLFIGTDSHTPNAGGLGALAVGVGGADAVDVMAGQAWELKKPQVIGVHLKGRLSGWASPKDVILKLLGILTVRGGTDKIIEYFGEGASTISATGKATITNMGAELGASSSVFPYDQKMKDYLKATSRQSLVSVLDEFSPQLSADEEALNQPEKHYSQVIEIDLSKLEPHVAGPHSPDLVRPLSRLKEEAQREGWPRRLSSALIGSCTNSSYEDIGRSAAVAKQALAEGISMPQPFLVTPGSEQIKKTIARDGYMETFEKAGALVLSNACGPCIGQWQRPVKKGEPNTILNSFNRNFKGRNDANPDTLSFIASPEVVTALGLAGSLDFNPETDELAQGDKKLRLRPPSAEELPKKPFVSDTAGYIPPKEEGAPRELKIKPSSQRLELLQPFPPWDEKDFAGLVILCKARGKCTTDHISPAGFWLKYRGHLDKISDNLLLGAVNDWTGETGRGQNLFSWKTAPFAQLARDYKKRGQAWIIIGGANYGEGSSREHAAMSPRHLGAKAVLAQSFARIHETNLKKQGVLPLCFVQAEDESRFRFDDRIHIKGLKRLRPKSRPIVFIRHKDGTEEQILARHSLNEEQIQWFRAGSSLNALKGDLNS